LTVTLTAAEIIKLGAIRGRTQVFSTKAYFAAESGAERILYDTRQGATPYNIESCASDDCIIFGSPDTCDADCANSNKIQPAEDGSTYKVKYKKDGVDNVILNIGTYKNVTRVVELKY
jgi:hypothetical protein